MTMITPSYLGETIEYSSLHACRSTLEDPTRQHLVPQLAQAWRRHCENRWRFRAEHRPVERRPGFCSHAHRFIAPARHQDRRRMGAGRTSRAIGVGMGLRFLAGRADRARQRRTAVAQGSRRDGVSRYSLPPSLSSRFCISSSWRLRSSISPPPCGLSDAGLACPPRANGGANMAKVFSNISIFRRT